MRNEVCSLDYGRHSKKRTSLGSVVEDVVASVMEYDSFHDGGFVHC